MALNLRSLALAAICTTLPLAAQASMITLDFEGLADGRILNTSPTAGMVTQMLSFSSPNSVSVIDIATAQLIDPIFPTPLPGSGSMFAGGVDFALNIDTSGCTVGAVPSLVFGCFNRLNMNYASSGGSITVFHTGGSEPPIILSGVGTVVTNWNVISSPGPISTAGLITKIVFAGTGGGAVYFDDLAMDYVGNFIAGPPNPGPGGTVPEPGGLALAALALAGLGLTRRRLGRSRQA